MVLFRLDARLEWLRRIEPLRLGKRAGSYPKLNVTAYSHYLQLCFVLEHSFERGDPLLEGIDLGARV